MPQRDDSSYIVDDSPMRERSGQLSDDEKDIKGTQRFTDTAHDVREQLEQRVMEYGRKAEDTIGSGKESAAGRLEIAAQKVRAQTGDSGVPVTAGTRLADTMERTADYLHEHETSEIMDDLAKYIREHPMQALVGGIVGGFVLGRIWA